MAIRLLINELIRFHCVPSDKEFYSLVIVSLSHSHCLYLQFNHYFETTYGSGYHTVDTGKVPEALKHLEGEFVSLRQLQSVTNLALRYINRFLCFTLNTFQKRLRIGSI